jgi:hypothetical protein
MGPIRSVIPGTIIIYNNKEYEVEDHYGNNVKLVDSNGVKQTITVDPAYEFSVIKIPEKTEKIFTITARCHYSYGGRCTTDIFSKDIEVNAYNIEKKVNQLVSEVRNHERCPKNGKEEFKLTSTMFSYTNREIYDEGDINLYIRGPIHIMKFIIPHMYDIRHLKTFEEELASC